MRSAVLLVISLALPAFCFGQTTWYVPDDFSTIQGAIDLAAEGDTIIVRPGTYVENIRYLGKAIAIRSESGPDLTVIDGHQAGSVVKCAGDVDQDTVLDGFSIINGSGTLKSGMLCGGGVYMSNRSDPTIIHCIFSRNSAEVGGGIFIDYLSEPTITDCVFSKNSAGQGGGLYSVNSHPRVSLCTFTENGAEDGGGMLHKNGHATVDDCTFSRNRSPGVGAGFFIQGGAPTVTGCTFTENEANGGGGICNGSAQSVITDCIFSENTALIPNGYYMYPEQGGGMLNIYSKPTVIDCQFIRNEASWDGGGMECVYSDSTLLRCTFIENQADWFGGGMESDEYSTASLTECAFIANKAGEGGGLNIEESSDTIVNRCTFMGNTAGSGGGMTIDYSELVVTNCVFSKNSATEGGGMFSEYTFDFPVVIDHCTFSKNTANVGGGMFIEDNSSPRVFNCIFQMDEPDEIKSKTGSNSTVTYCCVQDGYPGEGNIDSDPLFVDPDNDDFHLTMPSPCINRGMNAEVATEDMDGDPRPYMGTTDMGADEFIGVHALTAYSFTLSQSSGGLIPFFLQTDTAHAGEWYCLFATVSGTAPGLALPGGLTTLPINLDGFTNFVIFSLNTPYFYNFMNVLNGVGMGFAFLDIPANAIPPEAIGIKMQFAYTLENFDLASNPVEVMIWP